MFHRALAGLTLAALASSGCGGTRVVREPAPVEVATALAVASDARVEASLDWVIVRNSSTAWAKNADWDEYHLRIRNPSASPLELLDAAVVDSLGTRLQPLGTRKALVNASRQSARRYRDSGLKIKAGVGGTGLIIAGASATGVVGAAHVAASAYAAGMGGGTLSLTAAGAGLLVAGPAVLAAGIVRAVNNTKVNNRIESLHASLPLVVAGGTERRIVLFFPLAPSPQSVQLTYRDAQGEGILAIDTAQALAGLHLPGGENVAMDATNR